MELFEIPKVLYKFPIIIMIIIHTMKESALKVDSGIKVPCWTGELNQHQYCIWLFASVWHSTIWAISLFGGEIAQMVECQTDELSHLQKECSTSNSLTHCQLNYLDSRKNIQISLLLYQPNYLTLAKNVPKLVWHSTVWAVSLPKRMF